MTGASIRRLVETDAPAFRALRLMALRTAPEAFGSSYDTEKDRAESEFAQTLARSYVAGAWIGPDLVGTAGFYPETGIKEAHRGKIWGVFVHPDHRGLGIARSLIEHLIAVARPQVVQLHLSAVTANSGAIGLYQSLGFTIYGTEPRALRVDGRYFDEHLMVLRLDG